MKLPSFPDGWDDEKITQFLLDNEYHSIVKLPDGTWAALTKLLYTTGLCVGLDDLGWAARYCFKDTGKAVSELCKLKRMTEAPSGFIAQRGGVTVFEERKT